MRVNLFRSFAALLGLGVASFGFADFGQNQSGAYVPPSKWSSFNAPTTSPGTAFRMATPRNPYSERLTAVKPLAPQPRYETSTPIDSFGAQPLFPDTPSVLPVAGNVPTTSVQQPSGNQVRRASTGHMPAGTFYEDGFSTIAPGAHHP